ncbi:hypothetical protein HZ993_00235 [Rhodoferax sp. AJA081-3]|uniref:hypothetical protein n=1 Tax=Rhodoferax sp. AJA081-3 TaxID=2752316 RepID=UPI001ADF49ED|nr:hypothetical protein [Rhodoferax sp. AJA081-3]QTN28328.1 hypothetical protein HZ993_00235 [Rhodoferax sp. AJA081-3]
MRSDIEYILVHAALVGLSAMLLVSVFAIRLQRVNGPVTSLTFGRAFAIAGLSLTLALAAAAAVGILVMFGPPHFTGDFIGLPWYTMFPAWLLAAFVGVWVYMRLSRSLVRGPV